MNQINPKGAGRKPKAATNRVDEFLMLVVEKVRNGKLKVELLDDGSIDIQGCKSNFLTLKRIESVADSGRKTLQKSLQVETDEDVFNFTGKYVRRLERACADILGGRTTQARYSEADLNELMNCI